MAAVTVTRGLGSLMQPGELEHVTLEDGHDLADLMNNDLAPVHGWWSPGVFRPGYRNKENWYGSTLAVLDLDSVEAKAPLMDADRLHMLGSVEAMPWALAWHPTPHGFRLVAALSRPVKDREHYSGIIDALTEFLAPFLAGTGLFVDPGSRQPHRGFYGPCTRVDGVARTDEASGCVPTEPFDVGSALEARREPAPAGRRIGGRRASVDLEAARAAYNADQAGGPAVHLECPACGHRGCFQWDGSGRWCCYSTDHAAQAPGVGRQTGEVFTGDPLDLACPDTSEQREFLLEAGYLEPRRPAPAAGSDSGTVERVPIMLPGEGHDGVQGLEQTAPAFTNAVVEAMPGDLLFRRGDTLVTLDQDKGNLAQVGPSRMLTLMQRYTWTYSWVKAKGTPPRPAFRVPRAWSGHVTDEAPQHQRVKHVDTVVSHPVLARADNDALRVCVDGYDAEARVYTLPCGEELRTDMPATEARAVLADLLVDYPFQDDASMQNAVSMMVTLVCRPAVNVAPLFYFGARLPGTGKTKLANDTISRAVRGADANLATYKGSEEEMRKYLESVLLAGESFVVIDNAPAHKVVDSASLAAVLTMSRINMRILGETRESSVGNRLTLAISGNNTRLSHELVRRTCPIMLEPLDANPESRDDFQHPHARTYARAQRGAVLSAILSAAKRWSDSGMPEPVVMPRIGSYEEWRNVVGGIMEHGLGYTQTMANQQEFMDTSGDGARDDAAQLAQLFRSQYGMGAGNSKPAKVLCALADANELFQDAMERCRQEDGPRRASYFQRRVMMPLRGTPTSAGMAFNTPDRGSSWFLQALNAGGRVAVS